MITNSNGRWTSYPKRPQPLTYLESTEPFSAVTFHYTCLYASIYTADNENYSALIIYNPSTVSCAAPLILNLLISRPCRKTQHRVSRLHSEQLKRDGVSPPSFQAIIAAPTADPALRCASQHYLFQHLHAPPWPPTRCLLVTAVESARPDEGEDTNRQTKPC